LLRQLELDQQALDAHDGLLRQDVVAELGADGGLQQCGQQLQLLGPPAISALPRES
jgi:hypothetical protein